MLQDKLKKLEYMIDDMFEEMNKKAISVICTNLPDKAIYNLNLIDGVRSQRHLV